MRDRGGEAELLNEAMRGRRRGIPRAFLSGWPVGPSGDYPLSRSYLGQQPRSP